MLAGILIGDPSKINAIRFDSQRGFIWGSGGAPEDEEDRQPMEYLKKYLINGQYSVAAGSMYWLNASRFYTYSQSLLSEENRPQQYISKSLYEFASIVNGEYWQDNGDYPICIEPAGSPPMVATGILNALLHYFAFSRFFWVKFLYYLEAN